MAPTEEEDAAASAMARLEVTNGAAGDRGRPSCDAWPRSPAVRARDLAAAARRERAAGAAAVLGESEKGGSAI